MESHVDRILKALPQAKNRTELLLRVFQQTRATTTSESRNEVMCKKCLTPWTPNGQFTLKIRPANHRRKARRKFQIERLQKEAKSKAADGASLSSKIARLKQQNNHVALYKCFCKTSASTKVHLRKRGGDDSRGGRGGEEVVEERGEKRDKSATAVKTNSTTTMIEPAVKKQKNRRKKTTAGLIIPPPKNPAAVQSKPAASINFSRLSKMFQQQQQQHSESLTPQSKLNQFFK